MITHKPIKRNTAIAGFSRDHHLGLLLVWKIRQGLQLSIDYDRISAYILFSFEDHLKQHFDEEEQLLFNLLPEDNDLRLSAENDHKELSDLIIKIESAPNRSVIAEFANKLEQHIRFEERILFSYIQDHFSKEQLTSIAKQMEISHGKLHEDQWQDTFWIENEKAIN